MTDRPGTTGGASPWRTVAVPADRLPRWVAGFARHHGEALAGTAEPATGFLRITAPDGALAVLRPPTVPDHAAPDHTAGDHTAGEALTGEALTGAVTALADGVLSAGTVGVVLVRRGGFAAAVVERGSLAAHRVGSRHVQGRTAAGGWSQQRFARRRRKQTDELADAAVRLAAEVLSPWSGRLDTLATGGDRPLVEQVLADSSLSFLSDLPHRPHLAVGDPKGTLVRTLPALLSAVRIDLCP
ncbi:MAG: hypothetical protein QG608_325 [Actinomycetota bacterium]|nr:hypothetical protein [Actinomycetota bacterium]